MPALKKKKNQMKWIPRVEIMLGVDYLIVAEDVLSDQRQTGSDIALIQSESCFSFAEFFGQTSLPRQNLRGKKKKKEKKIIINNNESRCLNEDTLTVRGRCS